MVVHRVNHMSDHFRKFRRFVRALGAICREGVRGGAHAIDWFGLRLVVLALVGLTGFAILQPLIWTRVLHQTAPPGTPDLSSLVAVVVSIMSLGLAAFGVGAYKLTQRSIEQQLERRARSLNDELKWEAARAVGRLYLSLSFQAYRTYEDRWLEKLYAPDDLKNQSVLPFVEAAIDNSERALAEFDTLPPRVRETTKCADAIMACKGNVTYFLATRRTEDDRRRVVTFADELLEHVEEMSKGANSPASRNEVARQRETVAWAYLRYSRSVDLSEWQDKKLWVRGLEQLSAAMRGVELDPEALDRRTKRYYGVFISLPQEQTQELRTALAS